MVQSFLVCIGAHPPERISLLRWGPSARRRHAFYLPPHRSSMRSQQLAVLDMGAPRGIGLARGRIADVNVHRSTWRV